MESTIQAFRPELVRRVTDLTQRQLVRLEKHGIAAPSISERDGHWPALYSFQDVIRLKVAAEMLKRDMSAPEIKRLVDEYVSRGEADPLATLRFIGDPLEQPDEETGKRWHGRVFVLHGPEARSAHHVDQPAELFDLKMHDLRADLIGTIDELTTRSTGAVERARGVQGSQRVVAGTRIPTRLVAQLARAGWSHERILESYPSLTRDDIRAALRTERSETAA